MTIITTVRVIPPGVKAQTSTLVNGRTYTQSLGGYLDVPYSDGIELAANGWTQIVDGVCTTANRPTTLRGGQLLTSPLDMTILDTTLGYVIFWDGVVWRNPASGASV